MSSSVISGCITAVGGVLFSWNWCCTVLDPTVEEVKTWGWDVGISLGGGDLEGASGVSGKLLLTFAVGSLVLCFMRSMWRMLSQVFLGKCCSIFNLSNNSICWHLIHNSWVKSFISCVWLLNLRWLISLYVCICCVQIDLFFWCFFFLIVGQRGTVVVSGNRGHCVSPACPLLILFTLVILFFFFFGWFFDIKNTRLRFCHTVRSSCREFHPDRLNVTAK